MDLFLPVLNQKVLASSLGCRPSRTDRSFQAVEERVTKRSRAADEKKRVMKSESEQERQVVARDGTNSAWIPNSLELPCEVFAQLDVFEHALQLISPLISALSLEHPDQHLLRVLISALLVQQTLCEEELVLPFEDILVPDIAVQEHDVLENVFCIVRGTETASFPEHGMDEPRQLLDHSATQARQTGISGSAMGAGGWSTVSSSTALPRIGVDEFLECFAQCRVEDLG